MSRMENDNRTEKAKLRKERKQMAKKDFTKVPTPTADTNTAAPLFISGTTPGKKESRSKRVQILIRPSIYDELQRASEAAGTSMNDLINVFVEDGLEDLKNNGEGAKVYTTEDIAKKLNTTPRAVQRWILQRQLKAHKSGREWKIFEEDLQAFIERGGANAEKKAETT